MAKPLIPTLNRVLIEKIAPPSKTTAGILLPEKTSKLNSGKVIAVGSGLRDKAGNHIPVAVKEGDTVLLPEYGGTQLKLGEKEYHLYRDEDILGDFVRLIDDLNPEITDRVSLLLMIATF